MLKLKDLDALETKSLSQFSTKELEQELKVRKKAEMSRPSVKSNVKWTKVIVIAENIVNDVVSGSYHITDDHARYMFEEVMKTLYGRDFFDWFNKYS